MVGCVTLNDLEHHAIRLSGNGAGSRMNSTIRDKPCVGSCRKRHRRDDDGQCRSNKLNLELLYRIMHIRRLPPLRKRAGSRAGNLPFASHKP